MSASLPSSIGLVGAGRVASALGAAARGAGVPVAWVAGRTPTRVSALASRLDCPGTTLSSARPDAGLVIVAVSDDMLDAVATELAASASAVGRIVHTCGARGRDALRPLADLGWEVGAWHPLQAFATVDTPLASGVTFGITADDPLGGVMEALTRRLGGLPLTLSDADRPSYHAAATVSSNYTAVLLYHAATLLQARGLDRDVALTALLPLVRTTLDGIATNGLPAGLTGPAARGDAGTLVRHLEVLADHPAIEQLYRACGQATLPLLTERGLDPEARDRVRAAFTGDDFCSSCT